MRSALIIAKRELKSYFDSLMAYLLVIVFLGLSGFFTWLFGSNIFFLGQASLQVFFNVSYWSFFFFIPAITMRLLAEEKRTGTIELLCTKAISDTDIVVGKFLACLFLIFLSLFCTLPYYITISYLGEVDHGAVWGGYVGIYLFSASYISVGVFASSTTNNQIIAFLLALFIAIFFQLLFSVVGQNFQGLGGRIFDYLSMGTHFQSISRGVFDSRDLVYFFSIIVAGLYLSRFTLSRRIWRS
ncbi:MAG: ABC transporter permease subunit [Cytophagales bacterium]|nr:ABC transporter permease subunit [Cytophagales bacterium]